LLPYLVASGCGVPDVTFYPDDASTDVLKATPDASQAGDDASIDASAETSVDAQGDAGATGCPGAPPTGFVCCGSLACGGQCKSGDCGKCPACAGNEVCCVRGQGATCSDSGSCP
jgi:hypothetical protein